MSKKDRILLYFNVGLLLISIIMLFNSSLPLIVPFKPSGTTSTEILLKRAYANFLIPKHGAIHIGARYADELTAYKKFSIPDILWIEADPSAEKKLRSITATDPNSKIAMFAATDQNGTIALNVASNSGYSSSILKFKNHIHMDPSVTTKTIVTVPQKRLDDYLHKDPALKDIKYNLLVIDIQGAELRALKGAINTLQNIDAIISEINHDELYENAADVLELDKFLSAHGFIRVDTISINRAYGDALYVKRKFCKIKT